MTTRSPARTANTLRIGLSTGEEFTGIVGMRISADLDRATFAEATVTLAGLPSQPEVASLDPRVRTLIQFILAQYDPTVSMHDPIGQIPEEVEDVAVWGLMWLRSLRRNHINGETTLELAGGESLLEDQRNLATSVVTSTATTVGGLAQSAVDTVRALTPGSEPITIDAVAASTPLPAGERREWLQGESWQDFIQPELDAIGCRVIDAFGQSWLVAQRNTAYPTTLKLATYDGAPADADPIVTEIAEVVSREGDWADGVLIRYEPPSGTTSYQTSGTTNTKGFVLTRDRAAPSSNAATSMRARTQMRGYDLVVSARIRFDGIALASNNPRPQPLIVYTRDRTLTGTIRSVDWDTDTGLMVIRAQTGDPIE